MSLKSDSNPSKGAEKPAKDSNDLELDDFYRNFEVIPETACGYGFCSGSFLQRFANKKAYVLLFGISGAFFNMSFSYFNGTISTIEKRFKIPSQTTGMIAVANDVSLMLVSIFVAYYASKGHKPHWIALGFLMISGFCFMFALPHVIYGAPEALKFTKEYGIDSTGTDFLAVLEAEKQKLLCNTNSTLATTCEQQTNNWGPQLLFYSAQLLAGVGAALVGSLGVVYIDDNVKKSKSPALLSVSYFIRMLGPACGYTMASYCLNIYVFPSLTPTITPTDQRWMGAWWLGWLIMGGLLCIGAFFVGMFPKTLPRAAARREYIALKQKEEDDAAKKMDDLSSANKEELPASFSDLKITLRRLFKNKILMYNNFAGVFYMFGFTPYWIFTPKYIETQYKKSASSANFYTGTVAFVFSAIGILASGLIISKFKPSARKMAMWNVLVGALTAIGYLSYNLLGCSANDNAVVMNYGPRISGDVSLTCNSNCHCDYVKYAPVCGEDQRTYISACHAGCTERVIFNAVLNTTKTVFENCACIPGLNNATEFGTATPGSCPIDCSREFYIFLAVMCFLKCLGTSGIATNFLVGMRSVEEKDKPVVVGIGQFLSSLLAFIPSPIIFGKILDSACALWGKTCTSSGNCWIYDGPKLRYWLNTTASCSIMIATIFDLAVWYYAKDLVIFDKKLKNEEEEREVVGKEKENQDDPLEGEEGNKNKN